MELPSPDQLKEQAIAFLSDSENQREQEAAQWLADCDTEMKPLRDGDGKVTEVQIVFRCRSRQAFERYKEQEHQLGPWRERDTFFHVKSAVGAILGKEWKLGLFDFVPRNRGAARTRPNRRKPKLKVRVRRKPETTAVAVEAQPDPTDGERKVIGRLAYLAGFNKVWFDGEETDLSSRPKARACLRYMVEHKAFDVDSALPFRTEIDPYVRRQCQLPLLPADADTRIHHYFNPKNSSFDKLRCALIVCSGRCGRYYLRVR